MSNQKILFVFLTKIKAIGSILAILAILILTGCGNNVDSVKSGVFDDYQSTTVGKAFDNWGMCDSVTWEEFETSNGRNIVEYNCFQKNSLSPYLTDKEGIYTGEIMFATERLNKIIRQGVNLKIQFQINLDDSFDISYIGASSEGFKESNMAPVGSPDDFIGLIMANQIYTLMTAFNIVNQISFNSP